MTLLHSIFPAPLPSDEIPKTHCYELSNELEKICSKLNACLEETCGNSPEEWNGKTPNNYSKLNNIVILTLGNQVCV